MHVTSTDPRRAGVHDIAMFESDLIPVLEGYEWKIRHGQIENQYGKSLFGMITSIRKMGKTQREPNCDYTKDNLVPRPAPAVNGTVALAKFREDNPDWKNILWNKRNGTEFFAPMKYRNRSEWTTLTISLADGGTVDIKVNKWLVGKIPKKLVFRPKRNHNQLFLLPNRAQIKRPKHDNDRRHGKALTSYLLDDFGSDNASNSRLFDRFDYRMDEHGEFVQSCKPKNQWYDTELGTVLKITYPKDYCKRAWDDCLPHQYPKGPYFSMGDERHAYYLMVDDIGDVAKDYQWIMDQYEAKCSNYNGKPIRLTRFICELSGIQTKDIETPSRMSKYYEKTINSMTPSALNRRAKFENTICSDQKTSNRMYVQGKFVSHRRIYADKHIAIPELNITALDLRIESIRVGGSSEIL